MTQRFEEHERPRTSRLEKWRAEIMEMRAAKWPYQRIANWLWEESQFKITAEAVRQFCQVREIRKGKKNQTMPTQNPKRRCKLVPKPESTSTLKKEKLFEYDDSKPIQTRRT